MAENLGRDDFDCAQLRAALQEFGASIGARRIRPGDEAAFADPGPANLARRRASGAARIVARDLLSQLGADAAAPLARSPAGAPVWPRGFVGSLAHDADFAVAVAARRGRLIGIGVDVEPAEPLPADVVDFVLSGAERREAMDDRVAQRLVFVAKEAVYKALNPLDGAPLEFEDIAVALAEGRATSSDGRTLRLLTLAGERLVAVALAFDPHLVSQSDYRYSFEAKDRAGVLPATHGPTASGTARSENWDGTGRQRSRV